MAMLSMVLFMAGVTTFLVLTELGADVVGQPLTSAMRLQIVKAAAADIVAKLDQGQTSQADSLFHDDVAELQGQSDAYVDLARQLTHGSRPSDAARYLVSALKDDKDGAISWDPAVWWALSEAQTKVNDQQEAAHSLVEAAHREQAEVAKVGQPIPAGGDATTTAIFRLMRVAAYDSDPQFGTDGTARDLPTALRLLRDAVRIAPADSTNARDEMVTAMADNALGYTLADQGTTHADYGAAVDQTKHAVDLMQQAGADQPEILDSYGWALFKVNDLQGARRVLREAVDADPDEPESHYHLGMVYAQMGRAGDAQLELSRALVLDPDLREAKRALDKLHQPGAKGAVA
jgi:tetratricopeptide (TPR) repeat protein